MVSGVQQGDVLGLCVFGLQHGADYYHNAAENQQLLTVKPEEVLS